MIKSEYYNSYRGPNLTRALIWRNGEPKLDITEYTYDDIFPHRDHKYKFRVDFVDDSGRRHWFNGMVGSPEQYFNPPLAMPCN